MREFLEKNAMQLALIAVALVAAWSVLNFKVEDIDARVTALENQYPSAGWFDLKFQTIEDDIEDLKTRIELAYPDE